MLFCPVWVLANDATAMCIAAVVNAYWSLKMHRTTLLHFILTTCIHVCMHTSEILATSW